MKAVPGLSRRRNFAAAEMADAGVVAAAADASAADALDALSAAGAAAAEPLL